MKRFNIVFVILAAVLGLCLSACTENEPQKETTVMKNEEGLGKVIGIGGVFFKSQDPEKTKQWYEDCNKSQQQFGRKNCFSKHLHLLKASS